MEGVSKTLEKKGTLPLTSIFFLSLYFAEPHSSVDSAHDLRIGGLSFDPRLGQYSFQGLMNSHCDRINFSLTTVHYFDNGYVRKQPVA